MRFPSRWLWLATSCVVASVPSLLSAQTPGGSPAPVTNPATTAPAPAVAAAEPTLDELEARRRDKLAQPFLRLAPWHTDLDAALRAAARDGKLVLVHCTRTFVPCGTSIRCERGVLSSPEFVAFAEQVVLYVHTSAKLDPADDRRLSAWRGSGWPHHVLLDATGRVLGTHESWRDKTVAEFTAMLAAATQFLAVEQATTTATAAQDWQRLQAGLAAGALTLAEAQALFARSGVRSAAEATDAAARIADLEVAAVLAGLDRQDAVAKERAGRAFVAMHRAGKRPQARNAARDFWGGLALYCETQEKPDEAMWAEAMTELESRFANERGYRGFLDERRAKLAARRAPTPAPSPVTEPRRGG